MAGADLPTGTLTFLFTDIEGSTHLLEELGRGRYGEVLSEHRSLLRDVFDRHGGREVDTQGDAFFVAFRRARDAVAAAADSQRALSAHDWGAGTELRVRMGMHTGEAETDGDRYVGISVHRAQRICAAAHGGQVLLSATTGDVVADDLPPGVGLRDLGPQRLKDIVRPERVSQLVIDELPSVFPPLRTGARGRLGRRGVALLGAVALAVAGGAAAAIVFATTGSTPAKPIPVVANSLAVIDSASNRVVADKPVGSFPGVAVGAGGVWVMNAYDGTVTRFDGVTAEQVRNIAIGRYVSGITTGSSAAWASEPVAGTVSALTPGAESPLPIKVSGGDRAGAPGPVAVGYGSVWVAVDTPGNRLVRIDPTTNTVIARIGQVDIGDLRILDTSGGVTVGGGAVWVSAPADNAVLRIDPATNAVAGRIPIADGPAAITFGAGAVWVAVPSDDLVWRIDPGDLSTHPIRVGKYPTGVAVGLGAVWVANESAGTVSRIDPASRTVTRTIHVGHSPGAVAVGYGRVWVAVRSP